MNRKVIVISVVGALVLLLCGIGFGILMMTQVMPALGANGPAVSQGYGPGSNPGYGLPAGVTPPAQGFSPGFGPGMMGGRGPMMSGTPIVPEGYTPPSGGVGGLVAVSADGKPIPAPSDAPKLPENTAAQKIGNLNVTLAITPYPPASFQNGTFDITLTDDKGQAVTDATISLDLTMPGMWMPPSKPSAQSVGNGKYRAQAFWTMRGLWRIEMIIQRGGAKQSAFFDVWL
ncbi:MAG: FixH family protein [Chloroflexi bacterium]|nr:FixH family protein [Chloroflexota bacterium]